MTQKLLYSRGIKMYFTSYFLGFCCCCCCCLFVFFWRSKTKKMRFSLIFVEVNTCYLVLLWGVNDSNRTRTHSHLVRKWTLSHLAKLFLDIQATIECRFTLKRVRDMIITQLLWGVRKIYCSSPFVPRPEYSIFIGQRSGIRLFSHHFTTS